LFIHKSRKDKKSGKTDNNKPQILIFIKLHILSLYHKFLFYNKDMKIISKAKLRHYLLLAIVALVVYLYTVYFQKPTTQTIVKNTPSPTISSRVESASTSAIPSNAVTVKVTRVVDGDTFVIEGGQKVRYIGIDTPETVKPNTPVQCFGEQASQEDKKLIEGKTIQMVKDVSETDRYGRLLRYVYVDGIFVNDYLVRQGYAFLDTFPPDVAHADEFTQAQTEARDNNRGLWNPSACNGVHGVVKGQ
jgi:micrococcal nuclease